MTDTKHTRQAAAQASTATGRRAQVKQVAAARKLAAKAVVLGRVQARSGKVYQVLAPVAAPRHLSDLELDQAVDLMLAAR